MKQRRERDGGPQRPEGEAVELANELEAALDAMTEESYDAGAIQAYLDALEELVPVPPGRSEAEGYARLVGAVREEERTKKRKPVQKWRYLAAAAASVGLVFLLMIGAQAMGWNVFGALAQWTDKTFHFVPNAEEDGTVREDLSGRQLPPELIPTWYPEGFEMGEVEVQNGDGSICVIVPFSDGEREFRLEVTQHDKPMGILGQIFAKNNSKVETYTQNGRSFYLFKNGGQATAAWSDGNSWVVNITGEIATDDLKRIIDSMGKGEG